MTRRRIVSALPWALLFMLWLRLFVAMNAQADTRYLPNVSNGTAQLLPRSVDLRAAGYKFTGSTPMVACASDGTLWVSDYAIRPDGTEGHTVFSIDVANAQLIEQPEFRSPGSRGAIVGADMGRCGYTLLSTNAPNNTTIRIIQE